MSKIIRSPKIYLVFILIYAVNVVTSLAVHDYATAVGYGMAICANVLMMIDVWKRRKDPAHKTDWHWSTLTYAFLASALILVFFH